MWLIGFFSFVSERNLNPIFSELEAYGNAQIGWEFKKV